MPVRFFYDLSFLSYFFLLFLTVKVSAHCPDTVSFIVKLEQPSFIIAEQLSKTFKENMAGEDLLDK